MSALSSRGKAIRQVRQLLHGAGYRFRTRAHDLPGVPDIVLPGLRSVILVRGRAELSGCRGNRRGVGDPARWSARDGSAFDARAELERAGWRVFVVCECEAEDAAFAARLMAVLGPPAAPSN